METPEAPRGGVRKAQEGVSLPPDPSVWILIAACFASCIVQIQVTVVNVALPWIAEGLEAGVPDLQWVVITYTASFAALLLSAGALSDHLGAVRVFMGGLALFGLSSLACALAASPLMLYAARLVQGAAAALLVPSSLSLLRNACGDNRPKLAWAVALWSAVGGFSFAAGPVVGGVLLAVAGWRSVFLVNVVVCAAGLVAALRGVPKGRTGESPRTAIDWAGQGTAILAMAGWIGATTIAAQEGPQDPTALVLLALGVAAGLGFVIVERRAVAPILPLRLFRDRRFSAANMVGFLNNAAYTGIIFIIAIYLQNAVGYSSAQAGLAFLPLTVTLIVANLIAGWLIVRCGARLPMMLGGLIGAVGYLLLASLDENSSFPVMLPGFLLIPLGLGLTVPAITTAVLSSVESHHSGIASASLNTARQIGSAVGVAGFGAFAATDSVPGIVEALWFAGLASAALLAAAFAAAIAIGETPPATAVAPVNREG